VAGWAQLLEKPGPADRTGNGKAAMEPGWIVTIRKFANPSLPRIGDDTAATAKRAKSWLETRKACNRHSTVTSGLQIARPECAGRKS
jgi:hypothetical protein